MSLKVWSKFSAKYKDGTTVKLRIVNAPEALIEAALHLYVEYYVNEEPTFIAAGVPKSPEAMQELEGPLLEASAGEGLHVVVCCLDDGSDEINDVIGASVMTITSKNDPEPEYGAQTKEMKKFWEICLVMESYYDETKKLDLERRFTDKGLFVRPEYRGLGIAQELLKARRLICKEHGVPVHGAWMTTQGSQKAAERAGWETEFEIRNAELAKKSGVTFVKEHPPTSKFMITRV